MISYSEKMFPFPVLEHKLWIFLLPFHTIPMEFKDTVPSTRVYVKWLKGKSPSFCSQQGVLHTISLQGQ